MKNKKQDEGVEVEYTMGLANDPVLGECVQVSLSEPLAANEPVNIPVADLKKLLKING